MANTFQIPLTPSPQRFGITLGGLDYRLTLQHRNAPEGGWVLDIGNNQDEPIVLGIPLVTGANLLEQYPHLGFRGRLFVQTLDDPDAVPTFDNLGTESLLFWVTD
ncbi:MAG: hypothetical protein Q8S92_22715 [Hydrogenophaga sp.]|uniref:phage baseplate plug family protein n=1 Tax=Hydrogenophaga sp. TaxID=1904254 RepID=UPI002733D727|nr:hypothetical protein [Hydrogenophaga sp.]MDP3351808.1 hypothetical protein [Hydrogenophaga sp.]